MMYCLRCGAEFQPGMGFCDNCGMEAEASGDVELVPEDAPPKTKESFLKALAVKYWKPLAAGLCLVMMLVLMVMLTPSSPYVYNKGLLFAYSTEEEVVVLLANGRTERCAGINYALYQSMDGTKGALLATMQDGNANGGGPLRYTLYYADKRLEKVSDDVAFCVLAQEGGGVLYGKNTEDAGICELWLYDGQKSVLVTEGLPDVVYERPCLSPDGKWVGYRLGKGDEDAMGYIWDGEARELGRNTYPFAIANGGKYVYTGKSDGFLYAQRGVKGAGVKLGKNLLGRPSSIRFNADLSEVMYNDENGSVICRRAGTPQRVGDAMFQMVLPENTAAFAQEYYTVHGITGFAGAFYHAFAEGRMYDYESMNLVRISGRYKEEVVAQSIGFAYLNDDGKTLLYTQDERVYGINGAKRKAEARRLTEERIWGFVPAGKGTDFYYIDHENALHFQPEGGEAALVGEAQSGIVARFKGKLLYEQDGGLYTATGKKSARVKGMENGFRYVSFVKTCVGRIVLCVLTEDAYRYYTSADGERFTEIR